MLGRIAHLSETSAFKSAQDWPLLGQLLTMVVNELKALRGDMFGTPYTPVLPPSAQQIVDQQRSEARAVHDDINARLRGLKRD